MGPENVINKVFSLRLKKFCEDKEKCRKNRHNSPVFDLLETAMIFGVLGTVQAMTEGNSRIMSKKIWSKLIWDRAWDLDNANWHARNLVFKENDLLTKTIGDARYLTWWAISDTDYRLVRMCETMSRIICHSSQLKRDDYRLKGLPMSSKTCSKCDMFCIEDILHIVTQCPHYSNDQISMYEEIYRKCPNMKRIFEEYTESIPYFLLGREVPSCSNEEMVCLWKISGNAIASMYNKAISDKTGIG